METINNKNIDRLYIEDKEIILIGTAHVSKESAELVESVIEAERPDTVCVELCQSRYQSVIHRDRWLEMDIVKVIRGKKAFLLLSNLLLASFQKRIAEKLDIKPGEEMIRAVKTAESVGAQILLADRDIRTTLLRAWRATGWWGRIKLLFQLILSVVGGIDEITEADVERMKQEDILEMLLEDMGKSFPELRRILIDERDIYLCQKIRTAPGKKIVAVVGAGHVPGIRKHWKSEIDTAPLETIPSGGNIAKILQWIIPAGIIILIIVGFYRCGTKAGTDMIIWWILANGILAGIGSLIALAHPLTILSSMIAAPITSLNPMIAAGWVSGLVEAVSRKPKVFDFENLPQDIVSIKGFWKNRVTRILLVVVFTNLGSMAGTFVALPFMLKAMR